MHIKQHSPWIVVGTKQTSLLSILLPVNASPTASPLPLKPGPAQNRRAQQPAEHQYHFAWSFLLDPGRQSLLTALWFYSI